MITLMPVASDALVTFSGLAARTCGVAKADSAPAAMLPLSSARRLLRQPIIFSPWFMEKLVLAIVSGHRVRGFGREGNPLC